MLGATLARWPGSGGSGNSWLKTPGPEPGPLPTMAHWAMMRGGDVSDYEESSVNADAVQGAERRAPDAARAAAPVPVAPDPTAAEHANSERDRENPWGWPALRPFRVQAPTPATPAKPPPAPETPAKQGMRLPAVSPEPAALHLRAGAGQGRQDPCTPQRVCRQCRRAGRPAQHTRARVRGQG